jgi:excisionase family DNA binding protein
MDRLLLRVSEAAELLGLARSKVYEMAASGQIPVKRIGKCIRIPAAELQKWAIGDKSDHDNINDSSL